MFRVAITKHFQMVKHLRIMVFLTVQHKYWFLCNLWNHHHHHHHHHHNYYQYHYYYYYYHHHHHHHHHYHHHLYHHHHHHHHYYYYYYYYYYNNRKVCYIIYPISNAAIMQNCTKMRNLERCIY